MKHFQPNKAYYKTLIESFTRTDEFDLQDHVSITNEVPPLDLFPGLHSVMKNDMWAWFFGFSYTTKGLKYNLDTDNEEVFDSNGDAVAVGPAKYINGVRAANYGPIPVYKFKNGQYYLDNSEEGVRNDINGIVLPEYDLLLHECYRYLSRLYPTHPDWTCLLTNNEFNSQLNATAYLINHQIDSDTLEWLAETVTSDSDQKLQEAAMLKIRDLKTKAFVSKWAGSRVYYSMLADKIYQKATAYPVFKYAPLENLGDAPDENVSYDWFSRYEKVPEHFEDVIINKNHNMYGRLVRMIDWDASTYDFANRWEDVTAFYGTAYASPKGRYTLFEYPCARKIDAEDETLADTKFTMSDDFKAGDLIKMNGQNSDWEDYDTAHISSIESGTTYEPKVTLEVKKDGTLKSYSLNPGANTSGLVKINIDTPGKVVYKTLYKYHSTDKYLKYIDDPATYKSLLSGLNPVYNTLMYLHSLKDDKEELECCIDPRQTGCLYIEPEKQLSIYPEYPTVDKEWPEMNDGAVSLRDILTTEDGSFISEVVGTTDGEIDFKDVTSSGTTLNNYIDIANENSKAALTLNVNGEIVVLFGDMIYGTPSLNSYNKYINGTLHCDIKTIPEYKTPYLMNAIYADYYTLAKSKFEALKTLGVESEEINLLVDITSAYKAAKSGVSAAKASTIVNDSATWDPFIKNCDTLVSLFDNDEIEATLNEYLDKIKKANTSVNLSKLQKGEDIYSTYFEDFFDAVSSEYDKLTKHFILLISDQTFTYEVDTSKSEMRNADAVVHSVDETIAELKINKAHLFEDSLYTIVNGVTSFNSLLSFNKNTYGYLDYEQLPELISEGYVEDWDLGSLNTVSIVDSTFDDNYVWTTSDYTPSTYISSRDLMQLKESGDYKYFDVDDLLFDINEKEDLKYSYGSPNFLETFLTSDMKKNIRGEIDDTYNIPVTVQIIKGSNEIQFTTEDAMNKLELISTGDQMTGKYVPNDIYVKSIDRENHVVIVTDEMPITAEIDAKFLDRVRFYNESEPDQFYYRKFAARDKMADTYDFIAHVYDDAYKDTNKYAPLPPMSIRKWNIELTDALKEQISYKNAFNEIVKKSNSVTNKSPAFIINSPTIFVDLAPQRIFDSEYLMNTKILNWMSEYSRNRACAEVSFGTGISIWCKAGQYIGDDYSDETLEIKFNTRPDWSSSKSPYYAKIGTGRLDDSIWSDPSTSDEDSSSSSSSDNASYYNDENDPYGTALYSGESESSSSSSTESVDDIDEPLFKIPLNEYEVSKNKTYDNKTITTVQFSVKKQEIDSVVDSTAKVLDHNRDNDAMLSSVPSNSLSNPNTGKSITYLGNSSSTKLGHSLYQGLSYYKISSVMNYDGDTYYPDDLLIEVANSEWKPYSWEYDGIITTSVSALSDIYSDETPNISKNTVLSTNDDSLAVSLISRIKTLKEGSGITGYEKAKAWLNENNERVIHFVSYMDDTYFEKGTLLALIPIENSDPVVALVNKNIILATCELSSK